MESIESVMREYNNMQNTMKELILFGKFPKAKTLLKDIDYAIFRNLLFKIGYDDQSICSYAFICFLLLENETIQYHILASELLVSAFSHLEGAYVTALYHIRRTIELEPHNVELQANLLFFNDIPDKLISNEEAEAIALNVLVKNPNNLIALDFLSIFKK